MGIQINNKQVLDMNYLGKKAYSAVLNGDYVFASTLKKVSGMLQNIKDAAALPINKLYLEGNSYQETTSGRNLWKPFSKSSIVVEGVTITINDDGTITLNGTSTKQVWIELYYKFGNGTDNQTEPLLELTKGTEYTLSFKKISGSYTNLAHVYTQINETGFINVSESISSVTTTNANGIYRTWVTYVSGSIFDNYTFSYQIEKGSTATEYEPYTNGPSPNPDYPQEIEVIEGSVDVEVVGKNLLKYPYATTTVTRNGVTFTDNKDGSITLNGTSTASALFFISKEIWEYDTRLISLEKGTYTVSTGCNDPSAYIYINVFYEDGTNTYLRVGNKPSQLNVTSDGYMIIRVGNADKGYTFNNVTMYPMIEKGSTATEYEEHKSITASLDLQDNFIAKLGDVKDEIDVVTGKLTKRIGKVVLDGSETWESVGSMNTDDIHCYAYTNVFDKLFSTNTSDFKKSMCNRLPYINGLWAGVTVDKEVFSITSGMSRLRIAIKKTRLSSVSKSGLSAYLSENPIIIYYVLAEPYEVQLDTTKIPLFEGVNNIKIGTNLEPTLVETEYYMC